MARKPKTKPAATQKPHTETVEEYLARGGKIEYCEAGLRSEDVTYKFKYGRGKKKKED